MVLDVTHLVDESFWQAVEVFKGQLLASHQIRYLIQRDAVIGAVFDAWMLDPGWRVGETPNTPVRLEDVVNHIGHTCQLSGNARHAAPAVLAKTRRENPDRA